MDAGDLAAATSTLPVETANVQPLSELVLSDFEDSSEYSEYEDDAQRQWDDNIAQLERTLYLIICPMLGKVLGRRLAQNLWFRFVDYRWANYSRLKSDQ